MGYKEMVRQFEDTDLFRRMVANGWKFVFTPNGSDGLYLNVTAGKPLEPLLAEQDRKRKGPRTAVSAARRSRKYRKPR